MKYYLCITPFFPSESHFVGPYVLDQVKAIERNSDFKVIVLKPTLPYHKEKDYEFNGIAVYRFSDYSLPTNAFPNRLCDKLTTASVIRKLKKIGIDMNQIAVCHAHVIRFGAVAVILKEKSPNITSIVQHHGFDVMSVTDGRFAQYEWHKKHCIRHGVKICNSVNLNIGVSHKTLSYVMAQPGIKVKNSYVLYNGVDTSKFFPIEGGSKDSDFTIGCVANFWELKDQMTLIKAVEILINSGIKGIKTVFVGTGYTRKECEKYVQTHSLSNYFEFRTEMSHLELANFYRSINLFILPSYWEAFGCVYTEAYACGTPFIAVKEQGISEIIPASEQNHWLIDKGDFNTLAELIRNYKQNPSCKQVLTMPIDINFIIKQYLEHLKNSNCALH